jgi:hypothetical protein
MRRPIRARRRIEVTRGESVRILRGLQGSSRTALAARCGIPQSTNSAIGTSRVDLGVGRAKALARALRCHPAVLVFALWDIDDVA